jgi:hypothetical protein
MKKVLLCFLAPIALVACNKPEAEESAPSAPTPSRVARNGTPAPTPQAGDWMWKKANGKSRNVDPLAVKNDAFKNTPKAATPKAGLAVKDDPLERKSKK